MPNLPLLPTMGVGSYATPGWLFLFREQMQTGKTGPADIEEAFNDASRITIDDQIRAGVDIISDGELRRMRFVYEAYDRLAGLQRIPPQRRLGVPGYDKAPHFFAHERISAPDGLGIIGEFKELQRLCPTHPLKVALPGPLTFARNINPEPHYGTGTTGLKALLNDLAAIIRTEAETLATAGATFIQLDEPGFTNPCPGMMVAGTRLVRQELETTV